MVVAANPDPITFYSSLGFKPIDLISGVLGDRPEPVAMFLPIGQVAAAVNKAKRRIFRASTSPNDGSLFGVRPPDTSRITPPPPPRSGGECGEYFSNCE